MNTLLAEPSENYDQIKFYPNDSKAPEKCT